MNSPYKGKTILVIAAGLMQVPAIKIAREMGLKVVVTDYNKEAMGMKMADFPLVISTRDIDGTILKVKEFNRNHKIDGVITVGTDASRTVAAVANALGLPGIRFEVAERATNKIKMRQRFKKKNVPIPEFRSIWTLQEAKEAIDEFELPVVIKPSDNMGARGVKKITNKDQLINAFYETKDASISGEIIIEEFVDGRELSIDALVYDGDIHFMGIADRIIECEPYFVETGHIMPTNLAKKELEKVKKVMADGIKALGINHGTAKGDIRFTKKGPVIIELASRLSGGFMSAYTFPLSTDVSVIKGGIEIALGFKPSEVTHEHKRVTMEGAIIAKPGQVISVSGVDKAAKLKGVKEIFIHHEPGSHVEAPTNNMGKSGNIILFGKTRDEVLKTYEKAKKLIKFEIGEPPKLSLEQIRNEARKKMFPACKVCSVCDGYECAGKMPGMGGVGTASSFKSNLEALAKYKLNMRVIHDVKNPTLSSNFFGISLEFPVISAPMTGTVTNMGGQVEEEEFAESVVEGCKLAGTIAMVGDGASPEKYKVGLKAIKKSGGIGIPIFKPREFNEEIIKRIKDAEDIGAVAVGVDIDSAALITMKLKGQPVGPKSIKDLQEIRKSTNLPFILKGIMTKEDALLAIDSGADCIIVSNHGGRVMDYMPGAADILPSIVDLCKGRIKIMVDGGVRTGVDVFKCLAIGADFVSIGRPIAISGIGGGIYGVKYYLDSIKEELRKVMILTGTASIQSITRNVLYREE
ncbi:MAG: alpha-hydroxy-acid oxidizing protein [Nitrospinae bacterium]|nr:alpha-hydroxy-acid oxidizing protein [Nitrospinota bacterium]